MIAHQGSNRKEKFFKKANFLKAGLPGAVESAEIYRRAGAREMDFRCVRGSPKPQWIALLKDPFAEGHLFVITGGRTNRNIHEGHEGTRKCF
jgi:hypothetical protein